MSAPDDSIRISVSRDALRAELSSLELRLVDRITLALEGKADAHAVEAVRARVHSLESSAASVALLLKQLADQEGRLRALERFRYAVPSAAFISVIVSVLSVLYSFNAFG